MARPDDKKDQKRGPSRSKTEGAARKPGRATAASSGDAPGKKAAPRKKAAAAPPSRKSAKAAAAHPAPRARRAPAAPKPKSGRIIDKPAAKGAAKAAAKPAPPRRRAPAKKAGAARAKSAPALLDEEQRIEDAKYQPRELPPRLFEEERFVFPESYGQSRIRLLVKDPEWLFAYWDVDPQSLADLRAEIGERASALSTLTLRVTDPTHGGESRVLLPDGARSWYVRADTVERSYRAELGLTLPSGEFRGLAESNTVTPPGRGPARSGAPRRARYDGVTQPPALAPAAGAPAADASAAPAADPGPWRPDPSAPSYPGTVGVFNRSAESRRTGRPGEPSGGASDVYRR